MRLVLMTAARQATTEVLPALGLLGHQVRVVAPELSSLLDGDSGRRRPRRRPPRPRPGPHAVRACSPPPASPPSLVAVLSEGGLVALSADWGVDDVLLDTAGPAEVDARLKWATARRLAAADARRRRRRRRHPGRRAGHRRAQLLRQAARPPARPHLQGVRAAEVPGPAPGPGLLPRAAAAGDLGLRLLRRHPHRRRPRPPAARQARHRARGADRHRPQRRLQARPAGRRRDRAAAGEPTRRRPPPSWSEPALTARRVRGRRPARPGRRRRRPRAAARAPRPPTASGRSPRRPSCGCGTAGRPGGRDLLLRDAGGALVGYAAAATTARGRAGRRTREPGAGASARALLDRLVELAGAAAAVGLGARRPARLARSWPAARGFDRARVLLQMRPRPRRRRPRPAAGAARRRARAALPSRPGRGRPGCGSTPAPSPRTPSRAAGPPTDLRAARGGAVVRPGRLPPGLARRPRRRRRPARLRTGPRSTRPATSATSRSARSTCSASTPTRRGCGWAAR